MIVPDKHPKDKKSFDKTTRTWSFVCQRCGLEFSVKETELLKEVINPKRLLEEYPA
jgi:transcription elongation factor Elf1